MEQNDISVLNVFQHSPLNSQFVIGGPVLWVYRPAEQCQLPGFGHLSHRIGDKTARRPEKHRIAVLRKQRLRIQQFLCDLSAAHGAHGVVAVAVITDLMAFAEDPLGNIRIVLHPVTAQQKRGVGTPVIEPVQKPAGIFSGRSVVKGKCHILFLLRCLNREHRQRQEQEKCQKSSHRNRSFRWF